MNIKFFSLIFLALALGSLLVYQGTRATAALDRTPSEILAHGGGDIARVRIAGRVAAGTINYTVQPDIVLTFKVHDPGRDPNPQESMPAIAVEYRNLKPDMFTDGRDVLAEGEYRNGVLYAVRLLTQCPSKYIPASPAQDITKHD